MNPPVKKTKLFVAIPSIGTVSDSQSYTLRYMEKAYGDYIEFIYPDYCCRRVFHDYARNEMVEEFLESDADIIWFLDSDIAPPRHLLDVVAVHGDKWQIAGAPYPIFMAPAGEDCPQISFCVYRGEKMIHGSIPTSGFDWVEGIATGCLFIKREVFSKLERPFFEFKYDQTTRRMTEGEDLGFCKKLNKLGIKFFIDYSTVCGHNKTVDLLDLNNYAMSYAQKAVIAYEKSIRGTLLAYQEEVKNKLSQARASSKPKSRLILPGGAYDQI